MLLQNIGSLTQGWCLGVHLLCQEWCYCPRSATQGGSVGDILAQPPEELRAGSWVTQSETGAFAVSQGSCNSTEK
jgi:hypothetical protein